MRLVASLDKLGDHCRGGVGRKERERRKKGCIEEQVWEKRGNGGERVVVQVS